MSRVAVELDFFGLEEEKSSSCSSAIPRSLDGRRSFRGIQSAVSRINPEILRSVIASTSISATPTPKVEQNQWPPLPVYAPVLRPTNVAEASSKETAPLTMFYNGTVTVFDVSPDEAENIFKLAAAEASSKITRQENKIAATPSNDRQQLLGTRGGDLPLFRRKSLGRFLEKRKERLTSLSSNPPDSYSGTRFPEEDGGRGQIRHLENRRSVTGERKRHPPRR